MKYVKMLGIAAVVAMALAAFGASSASASELCSTKTAPCTGTKYGAGTAIEATSTSAVLTTTGGLINPVVTCTHSLVTGAVSNAGTTGVAVAGTINTLTFTGCTTNSGSTKCTATAENLPYLATGTANGGSPGNGTMTVENHGKGNPAASVACDGLPTCTYSGEVTLDVTGGNPAKIVASKELLTGGAFPCPTDATWTATYTVIKPNPLFLVHP